MAGAGGNPLTDKIVQLYILFDEGNDTPTGDRIAAAGFVYLDNITVTFNGTPKVFTGPMDNGNH